MKKILWVLFFSLSFQMFSQIYDFSYDLQGWKTGTFATDAIDTNNGYWVIKANNSYRGKFGKILSPIMKINNSKYMYITISNTTDSKELQLRIANRILGSKALLNDGSFQTYAYELNSEDVKTSQKFKMILKTKGGDALNSGVIKIDQILFSNERLVVSDLGANSDNELNKIEISLHPQIKTVSLVHAEGVTTEIYNEVGDLVKTASSIDIYIGDLDPGDYTFKFSKGELTRTIDLPVQ